MSSDVSKNAKGAVAVRLTKVEFRWPGKSGFGIQVEEFSVDRGEKVLLLGSSGSGKTTLLNLICGVFPPDRGTIEINGTNIVSLGAGARDRFRAENIGVIFQMFNLLPYASAIDNVVLPLAFAPRRRSRLAKPERQTATDLLLALGLQDQDIARVSASQLSVGQQQRVAVARALIGGPSLIIADEPTSALDAGSQRSFLKLLFEQVAAAHTSLLFVSHDERLAKEFDRVVQLKDIANTGRLAAA